MGKSEGPSVTFKVVVAFLLPIVVFIAVLIASEKILAGMINSREAQTVFNFLLALAAASVSILIVKMVGRQLRKDK